MPADTPLSAERLEEIRTLRAGITPGPWTADLREPWDMVIWGAEGTNPEVGDPQNPKLVMNIGAPIARVGDVCGSEADARFIAAAPQIADDCLALAEENARLREVLAKFVDDEECRLDHHGNCQEHSLGNPCEVAEARELLARLGWSAP